MLLTVENLMLHSVPTFAYFILIIFPSHPLMVYLMQSSNSVNAMWFCLLRSFLFLFLFLFFKVFLKKLIFLINVFYMYSNYFNIKYKFLKIKTNIFIYIQTKNTLKINNYKNTQDYLITAGYLFFSASSQGRCLGRGPSTFL
jgi:hypothetical protein